MRGLLVDVNIQGQMKSIQLIFKSTEWAEFWHDLDLEFLHFSQVGLNRRSKDSEIWRTCQREELILVTANRNHDGLDSLGEMIASENSDIALPAITIGDQEALRLSKQYALKVAIRILEILYDIDIYRGSGRAFVP